MEQQNAFDILIKNLSRRGVLYETHDSQKRFILPGTDQLLNSKYVIGSVGSFFFCAQDSYGTKAQTSATFSGVYAAINLPPEAECKIYRKDWFDRIFRLQKRKTGIKYIDDNLTITSSSGWTPSSMISYKDVSLYLEINKQINPLKMIIQNDYLSLTDDLKSKKILGIETDYWLYEDKDLDTLLNLGGQLIKSIISIRT